MLEFTLVNNHIKKRLAELNKELAGIQRIDCIQDRSTRLIEISREIRVASAELRALNQTKRAALKYSHKKVVASREMMRESREILKESAEQEIAAQTIAA